jgi:predicted glycosyltransferase/glycosyltransferase involved in cell wall biosynthesis
LLGKDEKAFCMRLDDLTFNDESFRVPCGPSAPQRGTTVFLYSHDTFGLGHLRRNLAIAEQLLSPAYGCNVWLLSGSPLLRQWDLPAGLNVQPLPPVVKTGAERYAPRTGNLPFGLHKGYRESLILQTVMRERPDVIRNLPDTRVILGLRDIIDTPSAVRDLWREEDTYALLSCAYDEILVYGSKNLFDAAEAYDLPPRLAEKLRYTGYVARPAPEPVSEPWPGLETQPGLRVLVTAGGGGDGYAMMDAYIKALSQLPPGTIASLLVPGPLMPPDQAAALRAAAAPRADVAFLRFTTDLVKLLSQAEAVVAMGGYNTTTEILAARKRAIIVPRATPRAEQLIRARILEKLNVVALAEEGEGLADRLAVLLPAVLTDIAGQESDWSQIDLDGAARAAALVADHPPKQVTQAVATQTSHPIAPEEPRRVAYLMKRYPRLSETFILNEIRAMEQLGEDLEIFSMLPPEPPPHHPTVALVKANVTHLPGTWLGWLGELARGHAASVVASPKGYFKGLAHATRISLGSRQPLSVWRQFLRAGFFATEARQRGVTHIHAHFANAPSAVAHMVSMMTGLPFSFTTHAKDLYLTPAPLIAGRVRAAQFVTTCTRYNVDYLRDLLPAQDHDKLNLVYHGIDLSRFRFRPPSYAFMEQGEPPLILCVARLVPKKGLDDLVAALALLRDRGFPFRCRIVGGGPLKDELATDIAERTLQDAVTLDGAMTHENLIALFAKADLFALAPRITDDGDRDGIPNVIVEALATGVPVVSTAVSGVPEIIEHENTGLLVSARDPAALAAAMMRLLSDAELGKRMAAAGRQRLDRCFDCWINTRALQGLVRGRLLCEAVEPDEPASRFKPYRPADETVAGLVEA